MDSACFSVYASVGLDCFVDAMYRHYASLPSLGKMDQWAMNKALNVVRDAPVSEIEDEGCWRIEFSPVEVWHRPNAHGDLETLPLTLRSARGRSRERVCEMLHKLGVGEEDVEKLLIFALLDRFYHDDDGRMDPTVVMSGMFDPSEERVKICVLSVDSRDDGKGPDRMRDGEVEKLCGFGERRRQVLKIMPRARFESLMRPALKKTHISLSVGTSH